MQFVAIELTMMQITIPKAITKRGNIKLLMKKLHDPFPTRVSQEMTKAAQVDSANDPKRSADIPATSPTLSPTLSAIVAGFLGLSSGRFC
jgi:hypothetical protein